MKKVVYSCITGGYDDVPKHKYIDRSWDYILFTDNEDLIKKGKVFQWVIKPLKFNKLTNVKNARWHKVNAHKLFPDYDYSLWLDACASIQNKTVFDNIEKFIKQDALLVVPTHYERNCIYDEAEIIKDWCIDYISIVDAEMEHLKREMYPKNYGLNDTSMLLRRHNKMKSALDLWWKMIKNYSKRDQLSFNYAMWKNNIKILSLYDDPQYYRHSGNIKFVFNPSHTHDRIKQKQPIKRTKRWVKLVCCFIPGKQNRKKFRQAY
jgi:hypothetical protein